MNRSMGKRRKKSQARQMGSFYWIIGLLIGLFTYFFIGLFPLKAQAEMMSSDNYYLELGKPLDTVSNIRHVQEVKGLSDDPRIIEGENFTAEQGIPYVFGFNDFVFSLSPLLIDYGTISPTNPITRLQNITVNLGSAFSYEVGGTEDHELRLQSGKTVIIPSTSCDDGQCSSQFASGWVNTLTFGFGYSCKNIDGQDCAIKKEGNFKHFPSQIDNDPQENILEGTGANKIKQAQVVYKLNTSTNQSTGLYSNVITYIAVPGY